MKYFLILPIMCLAVCSGDIQAQSNPAELGTSTAEPVALINSPIIDGKEADLTPDKTFTNEDIV